MASPKKNKNDVWHITASLNYKRCKLTLGLISKIEADQFAANLNLLINHRRRHDGVPLSLQSWVDSLCNTHREQLAGIGLISKYDSAITIHALIKDFLADYDDRPESEVKEATKKSMRNKLTHRIPKFFKAKKLNEIEPKRPDEMPNAKPTFSKSAEQIFVKVNSWQREHYALASWSRANGRLREVGNWAVDRGICRFNPFVLLPTPEQVNEARNEHISREWVLDVMDNCLDPDTRLVLALARFAGMRTPSECRRMKPEHIDFANRELTIIGKGKNRPVRRLPMFDLVYEELLLHKKAVDWGRNVFSPRLLSNTDSNNYSLITEAIERAGYDKWLRLRQNLRSSCENELLEAGFSERLVVAWLGHTQRTSRKSYQKQTLASFQNAVERARNCGL